MGEILKRVHSVLLPDGWHVVADAVDRPGDGSVLHEDGAVSFFEWAAPGALTTSLAGRLRYITAQEAHVHAVRYSEAGQPGKNWPTASR